MILTVDVGLKNLAMCIMDYDKTDPTNTQQYAIRLWDVYNILDDDSDHLCGGKMRNGKVCNKKALYKYKYGSSETDDVEAEQNNYTCKTHFPKDITMGPKNVIRVKAVKDYLLQDISRIVLQNIIQIHRANIDIFRHVTKVLIELQPKVNNKMKLISHLIYGKFVELYLDTSVPIRFVSASQKLKAYTGPPIECKLKGAYPRRKYLSVRYAQWILENKFCTDQIQRWIGVFSTKQKLDDKCDTFLMAINGITPYGRNKSGIVKENTKRVTARRKK